MVDIETFESALKARDTVLAMKLLASDPSLLKATMSTGISPITLAAYNGAWEIVRYLVAEGAIQSIFDAVLANEIEIVTSMLDQNPGALNSRNSDGFTPLHLACYFGMDAIALDLISRGADVAVWYENELRNQPLHAALAGRASDAVIESLVSHNADVNAMEYTPLMLAAANGRGNAIRTLLAHGADATRMLPDGKTAADLATESGHAELAPLLAGSEH